MSQVKPLIPVVPAFATTGFITFFWHLWVAFKHLVGFGRSADPAKITVRGNDPSKMMVFGQSCRSIFAVLWFRKIPDGSRVLVSPVHHHSFIRMIRSKPDREVTVLRQDGDSLLEPPGRSGKDFDVVVLTQMLGRDYELDWLLEWRRENPDLLVINDRVQGGLLTQEDTRFSDVSLYSLGQDKIPNTMGGGFAVVHHSEELWDYMVEQMETLPFESAWDRFMFVFNKIPTVLMYNARWFCKIVEFVFTLLGFKRNMAVDFYRKANPGFMHGEYMIRPSPALIESFTALSSPGAFAHWEAMQVTCHEKMAKFWTFVPEELHEKVAITGCKTACSYFFVRVPDTKESRLRMQDEGILTIMNQTYLAADAASAVLVHNMITLPTFLALTDTDLERTADAIVQCWNTVPEEVVTVEMFEARAAEAKKSGAHGTGL